MDSWFNTARFGMFVHWGPCSQQGLELSWPMVGGLPALPRCQSVSIAEYYSTTPTFNPLSYDPRQWARLAKHAGMRYALLTTKHHDGYAMFHTRLSDFSVEHSPYRHDIVRRFVDAFRAEGLRVGLYFSLCDWHHSDYPAFSEADKPYRFGQSPRPTAAQMERYIAFMFGQIRELLTNYGPIDVLWFDGGWERSAEQWRAKELVATIRELQPQILINDRLPGFGDFDTPEQFIPAIPPTRTWETCMTINRSWGYNPADRDLKSATSLIHAICEVAGRGGNFLLNFSPMGDGALAPEQLARLEAIASWMATNNESIGGTRPGLEPWQFYGPSTRRDDRIYLHLLMKPYETVSVRGFPVSSVKAVRALGFAEPLHYETRCTVIDALSQNPDPMGELIINVPPAAVDRHATVIAIEMNQQAQ